MRFQLHEKNLCLDVMDGDVTSGTFLWLSECIDPHGPYPSQSQQWTFDADTGHIQSMDEPSLCVDVPGGDVLGTRGQPHLWLWECLGDAVGQSFSFSSKDSTFFVSSYSDSCLSYQFIEPGGSVDVLNCTGDANMRWDVMPLSDFGLFAPMPVSDLLVV